VIYPFNLFINSAFKNFTHDHIYHNGFRIGGMKVVSDGSIQGYTGYLRQPYYVQPKGDEFHDTPCDHKIVENILLNDKDIELHSFKNKLPAKAPESGWRGLPAYSNQAELNQVVEQGLKNKYPMIFHSNGDAAIDQVILAVETGLKKYPVNDHRSTILHNLTLRNDQLDKIKALGIHLSFFPTHVYYWGDRHYSIYLGPERAEHMDPIASAIKHNITYTMHSDAPVTPLNPFVMLWSAMSRTTSGGRLLGADERISAIEALRGLTINAAKQYFEEPNKGSLEPGKSADLVVITDNPLEINVNKIKDIVVIETIKDGKTVYSKKNSTVNAG
jgi:predicted amidohydrolase YtcJ